MQPKNTIFWLLALLIWIGLFSYVGLKNLDPDFGWHLQMGRLIAKSGLPATDPFSYTMPTYPFIDHEWLTNLAMAQIHDSFGYPALAIVFGLLSGLLFTILSPPKKFIWATVPLLLGIGVFWSRAGIRPQLIDWVFLSLLLQLVWTPKRWSRLRGFTPLLFALWANLHGGFALGPAVLAFILFFQFLQNRKIIWSDVFLWFISLCATFFNPYGPRLWWEVWQQFTDTGLRTHIAEWQPFWARAELGIWLLLALSAALLVKSSKRSEIWKPALLTAFTIAGLSSLRHMPLLALVTILIATETFATIAKQLPIDPLTQSRARQFFRLLCLVSSLVVLSEIGVDIWKTHSQPTIFYPSQAVEFLKNQNYSGRLFSNYGWGGYLIWQYPQEKVFIDGRMPSFRWTAPETESSWAFKDYLQISESGDFTALFTKYNITTVLWPKNSILNLQEPADSLLSQFFPWLKPPPPSTSLLENLQQAGWQLVYDDGVAVVYIRS